LPLFARSHARSQAAARCRARADACPVNAGSSRNTWTRRYTRRRSPAVAAPEPRLGGRADRSARV